MATTYTWSFPTLEAYPTSGENTNVVFTIHWRLNADDGLGHTSTVYGTQSVQYEEGQTFTAYAELTAEMVQSWVEDAMGEEQVQSYKDNLATQIELQINPTSVSLTAPWNVSLTTP